MGPDAAEVAVEVLGITGLGGGGEDASRHLIGLRRGVDSRVDEVGEILLRGEPVLLMVEGAPHAMLVPGEPLNLLPFEDEVERWRDEVRCRVPLLKLFHLVIFLAFLLAQIGTANE